MGIFKRRNSLQTLVQGTGSQQWTDAAAEAVQAGTAATEPAPDRFEESLRRAAQDPAPRGQRRGVAKVLGGERETKRWVDETGSHRERDTEWVLDAEIEVHIPGRQAYVVQKPKVKIDAVDIAGTGYPILVAEADDEEIEFLPMGIDDLKENVGTAISDGVAKQLAGASEWQAEGMRDSLAAVTDPAQRAALIANFEAMGYEVPADLKANAGTASPDATASSAATDAQLRGIAEQQAEGIKQALAVTTDPKARAAIRANLEALGYEIPDD